MKRMIDNFSGAMSDYVVGTMIAISVGIVLIWQGEYLGGVFAFALTGLD